MWWIAIALLEAVLHSLANVLDSLLTNRLFKGVWALTFYSALFNVLYLPLVLPFAKLEWPPAHMWPFFALVGLTEVLYLYPYYKALQSEDTSVVSALFFLGKIAVPVFAFWWVGEMLHPTQYLGFLIIIMGGAILSLDHRTFRLNRSFLYMLTCSLLLSTEAVTYRYIFQNVNWGTGFVWAMILSFGFALLLLVVPTHRRNIKNQWQGFKKSLPVFAAEELLTFGGSAAFTVAVSIAPVTLVTGISAFQPFFVLLYAIIGARWLPHLFKERIERSVIIKKTLLFGIMVIGVVLAV